MKDEVRGTRAGGAITLFLVCLLLWSGGEASAAPPPLEVQVGARWASGLPDDGLQQVLVEIDVKNPGTAAQTGVTVTGSLPPGATVAWAEGNPAKNADSVVWAVGDVGPGERRGPYRYAVSGGLSVARNPTVQAGAGQGTSPPLSLRGLVGERGLAKTLLPNGLTVLTLARPDTPTVALRVGVLAGARNEDNLTAGGSHWLEHAHFLGTEKYPGGMSQLDAAIERVGGSMNATTGSEITSYFNLMPAGEFDLGLEVLAEQLLHSTFPEDAFNRERRVVFEELKRRNDSPSTLASDLLLGSVFKTSPLRRNPGGTVESVQAIPIAAILDYRRRRYFTGNAVVAIAGSIDHGQALAKVRASFASMPAGPRLPVEDGREPPRSAPTLTLVGGGVRQAEIRLGVPVSGLNNDDHYALTILDEVLDSAGRRLITEIRENHGLASQVSTGLTLYSDAGYWAASVTTTPDSVAQVRDLVLAEMRRLKDEPVTPQELESTVRFLLGRRTLSEESNSSRASRLASRELLGFPESAEEFAFRIRRVTPSDLQRVARKYFDTDNYAMVVVRS